MPFSFYNPPTLSAEQVNPFNAALSQAFKTYGQGVHAGYMPRMQEAEIFHKQFSPLAQFASSPLAMAMAPQQQQQVLGLISQMLGKTIGGQGQVGNTGNVGGYQSGTPDNTMQGSSGNVGSSGSNVNNDEVASPNQVHWIALHGNNVPMPAGWEPDNNERKELSLEPSHASNVPQGGQSTQAGVVAKTMAPYQQQVYSPGTTYYDPVTKEYRTTSTPTNLSQDQVGMGAIQSATPLIQKLQKEGEELLKPGRNIKYAKSIAAAIARGWNISPEILAQIGVTPDYYDKWEQFQKDQDAASERLATAYNYGNTLEGHAKAKGQVAPASFQTSEGYSKQLKNELKNLDNQKEIYTKHFSSGYQATPGSKLEAPIYSEEPAPKNKKSEVQHQRKIDGKVYHKINGQWFPVVGY